MGSRRGRGGAPLAAAGGGAWAARAGPGRVTAAAPGCELCPSSSSPVRGIRCLHKRSGAAGTGLRAGTSRQLSVKRAPRQDVSSGEHLGGEEGWDAHIWRWTPPSSDKALLSTARLLLNPGPARLRQQEETPGRFVFSKKQRGDDVGRFGNPFLIEIYNTASHINISETRKRNTQNSAMFQSTTRQNPK